MSPSPLRGRVLAVYLFLCAVWGSTWLVIRVGVRHLPPLHFAAMRMGLACAVLTPIAWLRAGDRPTRSEWAAIGWSGALQIGLSYAFVFVAATKIESGLSALLFGSFPIWVALFAHRMLPDEPLTRRTAAATILGIAGVAIIEAPAAASALRGDTGPLFTGGLLMLASAFVSAYANVLVKKRLGRVAPTMNVWGQTLSGSIVLLTAAALFEPGSVFRWTSTAVWALAYLVIFGTAITFVGLFWLVPRVPVSVIGSIPLVDTLIAVVLGAIVLGEALPRRVLAGGALILGGVLLAATAPQRRPPARAAQGAGG